MNALRLTSLFALVAMAGNLAAQPFIDISIDLRNFRANDPDNITGCVLELPNSDDKMYVHSGVCSATSAGLIPDDCQNPDFVWEHVVGDWGEDNGHGLMVESPDSVWSLTIDVATYYSNPATISQTGQPGQGGASTVLPSGATAYSMGFVFRDQTGTIGGITGGCTDFFIFDLDQGNTTVNVGINDPGTALPDTFFNVISGLEDALTVELRSTYPNPTTGEVKIAYNMLEYSPNMSIKIYDIAGREIRTLHQGAHQAGAFTALWDGRDESGTKVDQGVYFYTINDRGRTWSDKIMVVQ